MNFDAGVYKHAAPNGAVNLDLNIIKPLSIITHFINNLYSTPELMLLKTCSQRLARIGIVMRKNGNRQPETDI